MVDVPLNVYVSSEYSSAYGNVPEDSLVDDALLKNAAANSTSFNASLKGPKQPLWKPDSLRHGILQQFRTTWSELRHDLRTTKWLRGLGWYGLFLWICALLAVLTILGVLSVFTSHGACVPDDSFRLYPSSYNYWSSSGFFQITLGYGHLTFTEAKVVDIVWDVVFGRGGQAIIAFISMRVFARYLTMCMATSPITFKTYRTVFMQKEVTIFSIYELLKDFIGVLRIPSKSAMVFMILTMVFTLFFPTYASAMTGYSGNVGAFILDAKQTLLPFSQFRRALYVIHDGKKINQTDDYYISLDMYTSVDPVLGLQHEITWGECEAFRRISFYDYSDNLCDLQNNASAYAKEHGFGSKRTEKSTFMKFTLYDTTLDIEHFGLQGLWLWGNDTDDKQVTWLYSANQTFNQSYIEENGRCTPSSDYKWGFSFIQLFVMVIFLLIWTVGIYIMYLRAHFTPRLQTRTCVAGEIKAVFELSEAMKTGFQSIDEDPTNLEEHQLRRRIRDTLKGGQIAYNNTVPVLLDSPQRYSFRKGVLRWLRREKWWLIALVIVSTLFSTAWIYSSGFFLFMLGPVVGIIFAMQIGSTLRSRLFIVFVLSLASALAIMGYSIHVIQLCKASSAYGYYWRHYCSEFWLPIRVY